MSQVLSPQSQVEELSDENSFIVDGELLEDSANTTLIPVSYTHLTLPTNREV